MKRVVLAASILVFIVCYSITGIFIITKKNNRLVYLIENIQACYEIDDTQNALYYADLLDDEWSRYERYMSMLVADERIQNLNMSIVKIKPYLNEANDELIAEIKNIEHQIKMMYHAEIPTWYSII